MNPSVISSILKELKLNAYDIANIYHHGSWAYGTNSSTSDRDLIFITRLSQNPLVFHSDIDYFHQFELHRLWNEYDICIYSAANFEKLLEKNYLACVQCVFLPAQFKIKEEIDFQKIYSVKYYNESRLKLFAFYEMDRDLGLYNTRKYVNHPSPSSKSLTSKQSRDDYIVKNWLHGLRFLAFAEQLIRKGSIHNFTCVTHIWDEMKAIRGDPTDPTSLERVLKFVQTKSVELKSALNAHVPSAIIKGPFKVYITVDCSHDTEYVIEKLEEICDNTKFKIIFIELDGHREKKYVQQQLILAVNYDGKYPSILQKIEAEMAEKFQAFDRQRIKIKVPISNTRVPQNDVEKKFLWDAAKNYFEFRYEIAVVKQQKRVTIEKLRNMCRRWYTKNSNLSHDAFQRVHRRALPYVLTMRSFDTGRVDALKRHDDVLDHLRSLSLSPVNVDQEFVVYDSNIELDKN